MRYLVLTDIHANLEALDAVVEDANRRGFDATLVLGDVIGYGPDPDAVIERVQALHPAAIVRGNHDKVATEIGEAAHFNAAARAAAAWTYDVLTPEHRQWVAQLPQGPIVVDDLIEICHGTPFDEDRYVLDELDALQALKASSRPLCLFGHTHQPLFCQLTGDALATSTSDCLEVADGGKYLANPGSVGQPRDGDPRAAYAIVDEAVRRVNLYRVEYAIETTQVKMRDAGLPAPLARRLSAGR
jgi:predicted phosphodiesterase